MTSRRAAGCIALVVMLGLGACAETTVDPDMTTATTASPTGDDASSTASTAPVDRSAPELGEDLVAQARQLSALVVDGGGDEVVALNRLESTWDALRPSIEADREDLLLDFETAMALARRSVERRRPADADKAANNLATLVAAAGL